MCLVKMKVERDDDIPSPPRRIVVRPVSQHGGDRIVVAAHRLSTTSSRPVSRSRSHRSSHRSSRIISIVDPPPAATSRPAQYILSSSAVAPAAAAPGAPRASIPRIIHAAPSPPRSPRLNSSPRLSYSSLHSSSRNSPRASRSRVVSDGDIVYVSTERDRERDRPNPHRYSARAERPRSTGPFLTTAAAAALAASREDAIETYGYLQDRDADAGGALGPRMRSVTYATTGPRLSRERVLIEQDGRRRESYQVIGSR